MERGKLVLTSRNPSKQFERAFPAFRPLRSVHEFAVHFSNCDVDAVIDYCICGESISQREGRQAGIV
jgi:hypothetical protein